MDFRVLAGEVTLGLGQKGHSAALLGNTGPLSRRAHGEHSKVQAAGIRLLDLHLLDVLQGFHRFCWGRREVRGSRIKEGLRSPWRSPNRGLSFGSTGKQILGSLGFFV